MTRIEKKFKDLKKANKKAFIAFITAGDPTINKTEKIVYALEKAGVDILELGVPFSDPMADGPAIQRSSDRALIKNTSVSDVLNLIRRIRKRSDIPIILFTYYNPVFKMGLVKFAHQASAAGVDGVLATDLTPESSSEYRKIMRKEGLNMVFLAAPTTPKERLKKIARLSSGFLYYISTTGVTGVRKKLDASIKRQVDKIRQVTTLPVAVGFGVSKPEHVKKLSGIADGIVVGSAIVKKIEESRGDARAVGRYVAKLTRPLR